MPITEQRFKTRSLLASLVFIGTIVAGIILLHARLKAGSMPMASVVNCAMDLFFMVLGYVIFACCVIDRAKNQMNLNYYLLLLFTCFFANFMDECVWIVDGNLRFVFENQLVNTLYFMGAPILSFLFWKYVVSYLNVKNRLLKNFGIAITAGLAVALLVRIANSWSGFYFYIKPDGYYARGPLYLLSNLYTFITLTLTLTLVVIAGKKNRLKTHQVITLFIYVLVPIAISIISVLMYGLALTSPAIMLMLLLMYCKLNVIQSRERAVTDSELQTASTIQEAMLPHEFPPFPDRHEFDLFASMTPAKEVGGDFYDYYMPDDDHLVITIADVSGKGIPAALFMMVTKTLFKNRGLTDFDNCASILESVNDQICGNNEVNMFITLWIGILTISTGELKFANAGHEYPAIKRAGGKFELLKDHHSPPIGCMEGIPYKEQNIQLNPGDVIYIYTDGVTEATDNKQELFGEKRLLEALNLPGGEKMADLDKNVRESIIRFIAGNPQFDDITMLAMKYNGSRNKKGGLGHETTNS
jgi:serine phosphatase RsbU (regulator of sigma subunit)